MSHAAQDPDRPAVSGLTPRARAGALVTAPLRWLATLIDVPMRAWQRVAGRGGMIAVFLLPNMVIFGLFVLTPLVLNAMYSTTGGNAFFLQDRPSVGGAHYQRLLNCVNHLDPQTCQDDLFWTAVWNTARFVLFQVSLMTGAALVTALILNRALPAKGLWRAIFFFPVLLSPVVVGLIWKWILQRQGLLNLLMVQFGAEPVTWLTDRFWAFAAAVGVSVWAHMGFYALILLAGLQAIPRDLYEAAQMDGTPAGRVFRRITLPLLIPNLLVVVVLALIRAVQIFDEAYVLTGGGPGTSTMFITQYIFEVGFANLSRNPGLAAAASMLMAAVLVALTLMQLALGRKGKT